MQNPANVGNLSQQRPKASLHWALLRVRVSFYCRGKKFVPVQAVIILTWAWQLSVLPYPWTDIKHAHRCASAIACATADKYLLVNKYGTAQVHSKAKKRPKIASFPVKNSHHQWIVVCLKPKKIRCDSHIFAHRYRFFFWQQECELRGKNLKKIFLQEFCKSNQSINQSSTQSSDQIKSNVIWLFQRKNVNFFTIVFSSIQIDITNIFIINEFHHQRVSSSTNFIVVIKPNANWAKQSSSTNC